MMLHKLKILFPAIWGKCTTSSIYVYICICIICPFGIGKRIMELIDGIQQKKKYRELNNEGGTGKSGEKGNKRLNIQKSYTINEKVLENHGPKSGRALIIIIIFFYEHIFFIWGQTIIGQGWDIRVQTQLIIPLEGRV